MIARLAAAAAAALLACAPAVAQTPESGPWRLQRLYAPTTEVHEPFRFWLSVPDLAAAEGEARPRVRMLYLNDDGGWSVIATEYRCGEDLFRRTDGRRFDSSGRVMFADPYPPEYVTPGVLDPEHLVYGVVCNGEEAGTEEVTTLAAGREREAEDHARYLVVAEAAAVAAAAVPPVEEAPCHRNVLRNPFLAIPETGPAGDGGVPVMRVFMGRGQTLWAWRAADGRQPRWTSPEAPGDGPLYLAEGEGVVQSDVRATAGRWRLVVGAADGGAEPAGLTVTVNDGDDELFELEPLGPPTMNVIELEFPTDPEELSVTLTGHGPGEARLMMACLTKLD